MWSRRIPPATAGTSCPCTPSCYVQRRISALRRLRSTLRHQLPRRRSRKNHPPPISQKDWLQFPWHSYPPPSSDRRPYPYASGDLVKIVLDCSPVACLCRQRDIAIGPYEPEAAVVEGLTQRRLQNLSVLVL